MVELQIRLPDEAAQRLKALARERQTSPEELIAKTVMELLTHPDQELEEELDYLLRKHEELLRRLA
jgi:predicted transcriptional regulator